MKPISSSSGLLISLSENPAPMENMDLSSNGSLSAAIDSVSNRPVSKKALATDVMFFEMGIISISSLIFYFSRLAQLKT